MSTAVINGPIFECAELYKSAGAVKAKESQQQQQQPALRRSYTSLVSLIEQHRKLDRSVSEPTSRYKTELCRPFEESGSCKYGDKCQFAHGYGELRNLARHPKYKTELCRTFHKIGFCPYGPRCHFVHNFEEARIHNLKLSAQLGQPQPSLLLQPAQALSASLLEQLAAAPQVAVAALARATQQQQQPLPPPPPPQQQHQQHQHPPLHRSSSLGVASSSILIAGGRPKPLNLSPTFSLGSAADSISPSSSLSQSPTNSMASFFSDEATGLPASAFGFGQELTLLASSRQSPSPQSVFEEQSPRTPSPQAPNPESRLPVFNRISKTLGQLEKLKI